MRKSLRPSQAGAYEVILFENERGFQSDGNQGANNIPGIRSGEVSQTSIVTPVSLTSTQDMYMNSMLPRQPGGTATPPIQ